MGQIVRRNQAVLSAEEKRAYVDAVLQLKNGEWRIYDDYVTWHYLMATKSSTGHKGPGFLPWHRDFLLHFEESLAAVKPGISIPYWDWTKDNSEWSSLWNQEFMGGNGRATDGKVEDGPFAYDRGEWVCVTFDGDGGTQKYLTRDFGGASKVLPTAAAVDECLAATSYDVAPWDTTSRTGFRNMLEGWIPPGVHNMVHQWVGGAMEPPSSPNEPAFFLHHCNLDRLWAEWRQRHPGAPYVPVSGAPPGNNLSDVLPPWNERTIADLLDHQALGYQYDTEFPLPQGHQMLPGDTLVGGNEVRSGNGTYVLGYQTDGNLVLYPAADPHNVVWATGTWKNRDAGRCTMNFDGTLTVYGKGAPGQAPDQWHRPNARPPAAGCRLTVRDDGVIALHPADQPDQPLWTSKDP
ncbi:MULTISPECIES: tyrosinase family protein [unclassified Streptomyces]|uniref:tyrosinase family protein n=1 Tax=unclassified Streptomyces TaxID=2593676 RepID=UPI000805998D|nr:hypothetical protein [Streptomyces sp. SID4925]SBU94514.1 Common central domain of tyrosinase [Streptomyces sp. OspMP-M45]